MNVLKQITDIPGFRSVLGCCRCFPVVSGFFQTETEPKGSDDRGHDGTLPVTDLRSKPRQLRSVSFHRTMGKTKGFDPLVVKA